MDKSRQQFEATAVKRGLSIDKKKDSWGQDKYKYDMIQIMWEGWQASRESLEIELPPEQEVIDDYDMYEIGFNIAVNRLKEILIRNGVKIKNE